MSVLFFKERSCFHLLYNVGFWIRDIIKNIKNNTRYRNRQQNYIYKQRRSFNGVISSCIPSPTGSVRVDNSVQDIVKNINKAILFFKERSCFHLLYNVGFWIRDIIVSLFMNVYGYNQY
jgi:thermostable 8-oxoguanine DNA glycosylase